MWHGAEVPGGLQTEDSQVTRHALYPILSIYMAKRPGRTIRSTVAICFPHIYGKH